MDALDYMINTTYQTYDRVTMIGYHILAIEVFMLASTAIQLMWFIHKQIKGNGKDI